MCRLQVEAELRRNGREKGLGAEAPASSSQAVASGSLFFSTSVLKALVHPRVHAVPEIFWRGR